jgi:hypothetical protein
MERVDPCRGASRQIVRRQADGGNHRNRPAERRPIEAASVRQH